MIPTLEILSKILKHLKSRFCGFSSGRRYPRLQRKQRVHETLEPRVLLSASGNVPEIVEQFNLIKNGSFEEGNLNGTGFYESDEIPGWFSPESSGAEFELLQLTRGGEANYVLDLDGRVTNLGRAIQNVETAPGQTYLLSFDIRSRPGISPFSNDLRVHWNGDFVGRFQALDYWQNVSVEVTATTDLSNLVFREISESSHPQGDGRGPQIDNVRLVESREIPLTNPSFEEVNAEGNIVNHRDVPGWTFNLNYNERLKTMRIEDRDFAVEGDNVLLLNSNRRYQDQIYGFARVEEGKTYYLQFSVKQAGVMEDNEVRVRFEDQYAGRFQGGNRWNTYGVFVTSTSPVSARFFFGEPPGSSNADRGPMIDNVRFFEVTPDLDSPFIKGTAPGDGYEAAGGRITSIAFRFNEPIARDPISVDSFEFIEAGPNGVHGDDDDVMIPFTIRFATRDTIIGLDVAEQLPPGFYKGSVKESDVEDRFGNVLGDEVFSFSFRILESADD